MMKMFFFVTLDILYLVGHRHMIIDPSMMATQIK